MKTLTGIVRSTKMTKTAVVEVETFWQHPIYKKRIKKTKRYMAHNDQAVKDGDKVVIAETRPLSKLKRWTITTVVKK